MCLRMYAPAGGEQEGARPGKNEGVEAGCGASFVGHAADRQGKLAPPWEVTETMGSSDQETAIGPIHAARVGTAADKAE